MPLTHDIGVRIPYPLLSDRFPVAFFVCGSALGRSHSPEFRAVSASGRFRVPVFSRFQRFSDDVCFPIPCASRFRVFPTAACSRLPDSFACRVFAASRGRHVPDVFKCSGRPFRGGRCGIEVKGYLIGWWVYFSDLLLNLSI